jgi:hypothetical protein
MVKPGKKLRISPFMDLDATGGEMVFAGLDSSSHTMSRNDLLLIITELQEYLDLTAP